MTPQNNIPTIITLTGPSGAGKTTFANRLITLGIFSEIISTTTRAPRSGEINGESYYFVTPEEFSEIPMVESIEFSGAQYGGSVSEFERNFSNGKIPVIVVEPNGANQIAQEASNRGWNHIKIFIDAPMELLVKRTLLRFAQDYQQYMEDDDADGEKMLTTYARRFVSAMTIERDWIKQSCWDVIIPEFTPENEKYVLQQILEKFSLNTSAAD